MGRSWHLFLPATRPPLAALTFFLCCGAARADLKFTQPTVHVPEVRTSVPFTHQFAFVNEGPESVEITEVRAGCGCLTPRLSRRVLKAGEEGSLVLEVNTVVVSAGQHTWKVHLTYRRGDLPCETQLELTADVVAEVTVQPAALTIFTEDGAAQQFQLTDLRSQPLTVTAVRTSAAALKASLGETSRDGLGHWVHKINVEVTGDYPEGKHEEVVSISTNDPAYRDLKVPVTIIKRGKKRLSATPAALSIDVREGEPLPAPVVVLRDRQEQSVVVAKVTADHPALSCRWACGPGAMATLRICIDRERLPPGGFHSALQVHLSSPVEETITIPITCRVE
jgi:hypothetical protein